MESNHNLFITSEMLTLSEVTHLITSSLNWWRVLESNQPKQVMSLLSNHYSNPQYQYNSIFYFFKLAVCTGIEPVSQA